MKCHDLDISLPRYRIHHFKRDGWRTSRLATTAEYAAKQYRDCLYEPVRPSEQFRRPEEDMSWVRHGGAHQFLEELRNV